jgi:hypothetical protein
MRWRLSLWAEDAEVEGGSRGEFAVLFADELVVHADGDTREDGEERGEDGQAVAKGRVREVTARHPVLVPVVAAREQHDGERHHERCDEGEIGGGLHHEEGLALLTDLAHGIGGSGAGVEDPQEGHVNHLGQQRQRHQDLSRHEPRRHEPAADGNEFLGEGPPAAVVGLLCDVPVQHEAAETHLPQADLLKPAVASSSWLVCFRFYVYPIYFWTLLIK